MAWAALLPVLTEALAAFGITAEAAAAGTAARAAATGATAAAEAAQATAATASAANATGNAAGAASGAATGAKAAQTAESTSPTISQMFGKLWESFAGKSAEKAATEKARATAFEDANLGAAGGNPIRDHQSPSDKAAQDAATKIKDRVIGGATAMGSSLAANAAGSIIGGFVTQPERPGGSNIGTSQGSLTSAFDQMGAGPAGQRVAGLAQGGLNKAYDMAMAAPGPLFKPAMQIVDKISDFTPGVAQVKAVGKAAGELAQTMVQLPSIMEGWGRELLASQQYLARFNGNIAATFAEAERRDMLRNIESAQNTSGSTGMLSKSLDDLKDEMQPIRDVLTNGFNVVASIGIQAVTAIVTAIKTYNPLFRQALEAQELLARQEAANPPFVEFMRSVANGKLPNPRARK